MLTIYLLGYPFQPLCQNFPNTQFHNFRISSISFEVFSHFTSMPSNFTISQQYLGLFSLLLPIFTHFSSLSIYFTTYSFSLLNFTFSPLLYAIVSFRLTTKFSLFNGYFPQFPLFYTSLSDEVPKCKEPSKFSQMDEPPNVRCYSTNEENSCLG